MHITTISTINCLLYKKSSTLKAWTNVPAWTTDCKTGKVETPNAMPSLNDDDSSDDSSDDEFLTPGNKGDSQDREAMIRRKLMESFYGKSMTAAEPTSKVNDDSDDDDEKGHAISAVPEKHEQSQEEEDINMTSDDLDSPYFDPDAHTSKYVVNASVHDVLEVEERLALQVRTLDSTMQTLVYENYSKFIDATDAIRSIGVSVHANEEGLGKLSKGMHVIDETSRAVEDALGTLRDAVADKLRIKRLLTRLDALLKLPATLKQQIQHGQYRLATKSYLSAHAILSKHSAGFESLKIIEVDCHSILEDMVKSLKHKLMHWSGQNAGLLHSAVSIDEDDDDANAEAVDEDDQPTKIVHAVDHSKEVQGDWIPPPEPPKSVSDIFECASTLLIVLPKEGNANDDGITFDTGLTGPEYKSAALAATIRYLERVLDSHQIELQDAMFNNGFTDDSFDKNVLPPAPEIDAPKQSKLIPTIYLDNVLEAATLYGISFSIDGVPSLTDTDRLLLMDFVNDAFTAFLSHVRSLLLERSFDEEDEDEDRELLSGDGDEAYSEISSAMTHLLRAVRDLASGLALPDVGVDVQFASSLVDQAVIVTETMVRRRVAQKFINLRFSVIEDCLAPFAREAMTHVGNSDNARVVEIVQMASVALSDGLQLVDDTVKSILTGGVVVSDLKGVDYAMVKEAVQRCCRLFAMWLASTLEILAGCESSDRNLTIDAEEKVAEGGDESADDARTSEITSTMNENEMNELQHDHINEKVDSSLDKLLEELELTSTTESRSDLILAISEMCRLAQRSVMENINQSISTDSSGSRKHNRNSDIFTSSSSSSRAKALNEQDSKAADRFLLAASRVLALYAMNRGSEAALLACRGLHEVASEEGEGLPDSPRSAIVDMLHVVKMTSIDCANVFGGERQAGPVPDPPEDELDPFNTSVSSYRSKSLSSGLSSVKGLSLDVERMFTLKVPTFPHPSHVLTFSRNNVVFVVLKIALNAIMELVRSCTFNTKGYRQLQVDVLFVRFLLPHYVKDDMLAEGSNWCTILDNVLNDVMQNAGERCNDVECLGQDKFYDPTMGESVTLQSIIRDFMRDDRVLGDHKNNGDELEKVEHITTKFLIQADSGAE